ncbi:MAG: OadG family protein [Propionibacteriaceae bacterium]|jgi:hypothetical protein|nr:OadG family protein [Propionibacteriaceae bacterium]
MRIIDAVVVGLFCMSVVFAVLVVLWGAVAAFGRLIRFLEASPLGPGRGTGAGR